MLGTAKSCEVDVLGYLGFLSGCGGHNFVCISDHAGSLPHHVTWQWGHIFGTTENPSTLPMQRAVSKQPVVT